MAKAKKSKKGKKAKKAKKVVAAKKSAKKSSKKAAKKSAKKSAKKAAKKGEEIRQESRQESRGSAEEGRQEEPGEEKESSCAQAGAGPDGSSGAGARTGASPELGYAGALDPVMGIRLLQRRRPALADRLQNELSKGRSVHRCGLFREGCEVTGSRRFTGRLICKTRCSTASSVLVFWGSNCLRGTQKPPKM